MLDFSTMDLDHEKLNSTQTQNNHKWTPLPPKVHKPTRIQKSTTVTQKPNRNGNNSLKSQQNKNKSITTESSKRSIIPSQYSETNHENTHLTAFFPSKSSWPIDPPAVSFPASVPATSSSIFSAFGLLFSSTDRDSGSIDLWWDNKFTMVICMHQLTNLVDSISVLNCCGGWASSKNIITF